MQVMKLNMTFYLLGPDILSTNVLMSQALTDSTEQQKGRGEMVFLLGP
jgi:hypothetical protein